MKLRRCLFASSLWLAASTAPGQQPGPAAPVPATVTTPAPTLSPTVPPLAPRPPAPARPHSLNLEVTSLGQPNETHVLTDDQARRLGFQYHNTEYGNARTAVSTTIVYSKMALQITLRNFGQVPDQAVVECYFTAVPMVNRALSKNRFAPPPPEFVFDRSTQTVSVAAAASTRLSVASLEVRSAVTKTASVTSRDTSSSKNEEGTLLRGWVVRLVADGKVLAVQASSTGNEEVGRDEAKLAALLAVPRPYEARNRISIGPFNKSLYEH